MTPHNYAETIVLPTLREFLAERGDYRRAFIACVTTYHVVDYLAQVRGLRDSSKGAAKRAREVDVQQIRDGIRSTCMPSFDVVQGICNGTKHADLLETRQVPVFAFDVPGAGWGQGRWDVPGLQVEHNGQKLFVDWCVQTVLLTLRSTYGGWLDPIDLTFFDKAFRGQPGWG